MARIILRRDRREPGQRGTGREAADAPGPGRRGRRARALSGRSRGRRGHVPPVYRSYFCSTRASPRGVETPCPTTARPPQGPAARHHTAWAYSSSARRCGPAAQQQAKLRASSTRCPRSLCDTTDMSPDGDVAHIGYPSPSRNLMGVLPLTVSTSYRRSLCPSFARAAVGWPHAEDARRAAWHPELVT